VPCTTRSRYPLIVNRDDIPKRTRCSLVMAPFAGDGIILAPAIRRAIGAALSTAGAAP
jgi:hypothetical protein